MPINVGVKFKSCPILIRYSKCSLNLNSSILRQAAFFTKRASASECLSLTSYSAVSCRSTFPSPLVASVASLHTSLVIHDKNVPKADSECKKKRKPEVSLPEGPSLKDFILNSFETTDNVSAYQHEDESVPYLNKTDYSGNDRKVFFETYGCQMNENDTDIAWSILQTNGYQRTTSIKESDIILVMTCAIREGAEQKIWNRLEYLKGLKRFRQKQPSLPPLKIGILGCMAERLKAQIVEKEKSVDLVCGPDAYKDLPRMLSLTQSGQVAVNVLLSLDETYADVVPVRVNTDSPSAFVSIMRGCDNMCSYCIVPFTRGRERSRPIDSILDEIKQLSDQGVKEVTLLGQNVNSYRDVSSMDVHNISTSQSVPMSKGFRTIYKLKPGGRRFSDLLDQASLINPEMRIRFTSPHPKDFPDEVLHLIRERQNICDQIHLPAQSGSDSVLENMRRGYSVESYMELVHHIREILPNVSLSSDFIAGFCGETESDHQQTVELLRKVKYQFAFCFPYSMRQKTHAYHRLKDDVPADVKIRRHEELVAVFREVAERLNHDQIGQQQLILIEGTSKRSDKAVVGRNDGNTKVIVPSAEIPVSRTSGELRPMSSGDYVFVQITGGSSQVLKGIVLHHSTLTESFHKDLQNASSPISSSASPAGIVDGLHMIA